MGDKSPENSGINRFKSRIIQLTGLLVVLPALIYAGIDIYKAILDIPMNDVEAKNQKLFKKYFNKKPIHTVPIPIKKDGMVSEIKFSIFEEGDIYVEYGKSSQWFQSPLNQTKEAFNDIDFSLVSSAYAQDLSYLYGPYKQFDKYNGNLIQRTRKYRSGAVETLMINPRTGQILNQKVIAPKSSTQPSMTPQYGGIDLDNQYSVPPQTQLARYCVIPQGRCLLFQPIPVGSSCFCTSAHGPIYGIGQ